MAGTPADLCLVAAGVPPAGQHSNLVNPTSLSPTKIAVLTILVTWGTIFTAGRFFVNIRRLFLGDYFALIALCMSIMILGIGASQNKMDRHIWDTPSCFFDGAYVAKNIFAPAILFNAGSFFAKSSIFLLFHQIFTIQKTMRRAIWAGQILNFAVYSASIVAIIYYESPRVGEPWSAVLDGRTLIPLKWWQAQSAIIVLLDIYIFLLPLPNLWKLNIPLRRRIPVLAVFSLAMLGIATSIASLVVRIYIPKTLDVTWTATILSLCSAVELNVAIIISSGPGFASFVRSSFPILSSVAGSFFSSGSKVRDSEAMPVKPGYANSDRSSEPDYGTDPSLDRSLRFYEMNDTWMLKSGVTAEDVKLENTDGGIMRTIAVDQHVKMTTTKQVSNK